MAKENLNLISKKCKEDWLLKSFYVQAIPDVIIFFFQFSIMVENIARKPRSKHKRAPQQWWLYCLEENRVLLVVCIFLCTYWLFV